MRKVTPSVYIVGQTAMSEEGMDDFLEALGSPDWSSDAPSEAEALIEFEGRLCYRAFQPGLNPNVTKIRTENADYLQNLVRQGHGSCAEHATINFVFHNVSRVFTHELVRHRVGTAISQESLRFVRLGSLPMWVPSCFEKDNWALEQIEEILALLEEKAALFSAHFRLDDPTTPFSRKKEVTSAMRRFVATEGIATTIGWTANLRAIKNIVQARTHPAAEEEIRLVFDLVAEQVTRLYPNMFSDLEREVVNGIGYWSSTHGRF